MPRRRRRRQDTNRLEPLSTSAGFACARRSKPHRWPNPLHHRKRSTAHRHARLGSSHAKASGESWKLVLFLRSLRPLSHQEKSQQASVTLGALCWLASLPEVPCGIYTTGGRKRRWQTSCVTRANIPTPFIPDLATNHRGEIYSHEVAFVYGSIWKQRYFTKVDDDYFPSAGAVGRQDKNGCPISYRGADWWARFLPARQYAAPDRATCDGCHSVGYDIHTKRLRSGM